MVASAPQVYVSSANTGVEKCASSLLPPHTWAEPGRRHAETEASLLEAQEAQRRARASEMQSRNARDDLPFCQVQHSKHSTVSAVSACVGHREAGKPGGALPCCHADLVVSPCPACLEVETVVPTRSGHGDQAAQSRHQRATE
ncbi:hypothetical protein KVR01_004195 [Diaporthe batatas]|uniref:uncharacterized protein n=1 Tax=Diaporthe batatas TaxID=748121 RepID=UPI001D049D8E|nr:uncharacterized protein KVR01_004195 [Diaporthe batatas]KAG8165643.1 hypothetical protein KVR01_004195 [Diaporthe batatas]